MSTAPFLPLAVPDFVADTLEMDAKEVGAYMLLLMSLWQRKGYLPNDHSKLKRVARIGRDWPKVWAAMEQHFEVSGGRIYNIKLLAIVTKVADQRAVNAHSGALGGRAKALKEKKARLANATIPSQQLELEPYIEKRDTKVSPKKTGTRIPDNWVLPNDWGEWAVSEGYPEAGIRLEAAKFHDYWKAKSGRGATKLGWAATWRNWMRNSKTPKAINGGYENGKPASKSAQRIRAWTEGARGTFGAS